LAAEEWRGEDSLQKIWDLAKDNLTTEEIKYKLLLATNSEGNTAWHIAAGQSVTKYNLQKIWDLAKDNLTTEEIKYKLLLATNSEGNTACYLAAMGLYGEAVLQIICDLAENYLTTEEIENSLITPKHHQRNTPRRSEAKLGKRNVLKKVWDWTKVVIFHRQTGQYHMAHSSVLGQTSEVPYNME
jgi:sucrose-6-phosphate hydrolase SacC (GH32 family)